MTHLEDALKRLDKLTYEQSQMATAEVQRATQVNDEMVGEVREQATAVDVRMTTAEVQRATQVNDERVGEVREQGSAVDVREVSVDDEAEVINGLHPLTFISTSLNPCSPFL